MSKSREQLAALLGRGVMCGVLLWPALAPALPGEVSFTPTGLRLSIMSISLWATDANGNPTSQAVLYTCPHDSEEQCLIDVTDQSALDSLATSLGSSGSTSVNVGTYDTVSLSLCSAGKPGGTPAPGFVRGSFSVPSEHKTYATTAAPEAPLGLKEVAADDATGGEFTAIGNWGCSNKTVRLPAPVTISADTDTDLTVVMDSSLLAFSTPNVSGGMGGCRGLANGQARGICVSYPSLVPLIAEAEPSFDRFIVAHHRTDATAIDDSKANAYVVVVRSTGAGIPITAFVRPYYSETSAQSSAHESYDLVFGGPGYFGETLVSSVHASVDGALDFTTGGSLDGNAAIFEHFETHDHLGVVGTREDGTWQYHAMPILP